MGGHSEERYDPKDLIRLKDIWLQIQLMPVKLLGGQLETFQIKPLFC